MSLASNISFCNFCDLCSKINEATKPKKIEILSRYIANWRQLGDKLKATNASLDTSFFPVLRLLLPQLDRDRGAYGIKEHTLAKIYIRILCLPSDGTDAVKLLKYKVPKSAGNEAGDFASVAFWILKKCCIKGNELSIEDVNNSLTTIASKHTQHDPRGVDSELTYLLQNTSPEEQKWLIRVILKDLKFGMGQSSIFRTFHNDAKDLYDVSNNLSKVCQTLCDPSRHLHEIEVELFSAFRPMLSEEMDARRIDRYFNRTQYFFVETKLDGERFQLHMDQGKFMYFSRNGFDYTNSFGGSVRDGILTPHLAAQISSDVKSVILDGEMMCWNPKKLRYTTKGMDIDVKKLNSSHVHKPCFCVFDILLCNGEILTNKPLINRLDRLEKIISPLQGVISLLSRKKVSTKEEVFTAVNDAMDDCEEGVILKEFSAPYKPNARKGGGWYKIKPEFTDGLLDTLDLIIIGGYHGGGWHKGKISNFLMAVASSEPGKFLSTVKVSSGYSKKVLEDLQTRLEPFWQNSIPEDVGVAKEKAEVWIQPEKSIVLEIKASEIIPSDYYQTGYTLRFPRVVNIRYDKSWTDCTTFTEFEDKRRNTSGKLTANRLSEEDLSPVKAKVRRVAKSQLHVGAQFKAADTSNVETVSQLLQSKEICVMSGYGKKTKADIEKKIVKFGGEIVQNPTINTWCVLSEDETFRVSNIIARQQHDVVRISWLLPLLTSDTMSLPEIPRHSFLGMSLRTEASMKKRFDDYGDHFTVPATVDSLKQCMALAAKAGVQSLTYLEKAELDTELFPELNPFQIFRPSVVFVDPIDEKCFDVKLALFRIEYYGGIRASELDCSVTHVLCIPGSEQYKTIKHLRRQREVKFRIISPAWVAACVKAKEVLNTDETFTISAQFM